MRRALVVLAASLAFPAAASAHTARRASLPPQGIYQECEPSAGCAFQLAMAANAGFRFVLDYAAWYGSQQQVLEYASEAHADGLQVIWPFNAQQFVNAPGSVAPFVSLVNGLPATWGYYVGDETPVAEQGNVAAISATIRGMSHKHLMFVADSPTGAAGNLAPFHADAGWLGGDTYPVGTGAPVSYVQRVADAVHKVAHEYEKHSVMVLQAFSWAEYNGSTAPFPSKAEMAAMESYALAGDPDVGLVMWYSQKDVLASSAPEANWLALSQAAF